MDNEPLVAGGQGRSAQEVEDAGRVCGWLFIAVIGFLGILAVLFVGGLKRGAL